MTKILVVEDSVEMLSNIKAILSLNGFSVITAKDGFEGLNKAKYHCPDVIISDIMMPVMDGFEMLNAIRENEFLQTTPVIFLTARVDRKDLRDGMALGADDYITKPFRSSELIASVEAQIKKKLRFKSKYDEIAQNISIYIPHELRTPLIAIMGYTDLLLNDPSGWDEETKTNMLSSIKKASGRLYKTIEKFIHYSEIEVLLAGKEDYSSEEVQEVSAKDNVSLVAHKISQRYLRSEDLHVSLNDTMLKIDEKHFQLLLEELIDNAFKFSDKNQFVEIKEVSCIDSFILEITNQGRGMSKEEIEKINPFIQHNRKQLAQTGSGLGLVTALKLSKLYDINFELQSEMNQYFSVKLKFPNKRVAHCA
jgi:two-component system, sensor histidine kinase and response regulator